MSQKEKERKTVLGGPTAIGGGEILATSSKKKKPHLKKGKQKVSASG